MPFLRYLKTLHQRDGLMAKAKTIYNTHLVRRPCVRSPTKAGSQGSYESHDGFTGRNLLLLQTSHDASFPNYPSRSLTQLKESQTFYFTSKITDEQKTPQWPRRAKPTANGSGEAWQANYFQEVQMATESRAARQGRALSTSCLHS